MQQVKVPKEVMELVYESEACTALAQHYGDSFFSFPKSVYYAAKAVKADRLARRALAHAHPETSKGKWVINAITGVAVKEEEPKPVAEKKPRKPRAPKPAAEAAKPEGEQQ